MVCVVLRIRGLFNINVLLGNKQQPQQMLTVKAQRLQFKVGLSLFLSLSALVFKISQMRMVELFFLSGDPFDLF